MYYHQTKIENPINIYNYLKTNIGNYSINSSTNNYDGSVRTTIFRILETVLMQNQSSLKNIQIKLINLIYEEESLVDNVLDLILKLHHSKDAHL